MSSSLSTFVASSAMQWKYDVFLNFRGGDVREKFLSHLREALVRAKLVTFFDEDLRRGEEISPALLRAIEESHVAVTIFSKDYASSPWCLEELVKIIECYQYRGQIVIPVFYDVSSSVVLEQSGIYAEAFAKHERDRENARNVPRWKAAMTKAANLAGRSARNTRPESKLVTEIVNDILTSLGRTSDGIDGTVETASGLQKSWSLKVSETRTVEVQGTGELTVDKYGKLPVENLVLLSEPSRTSETEVTTSTRENNLLTKTSVKMRTSGSSPNTSMSDSLTTQNLLPKASPQLLENTKPDLSYNPASSLGTLGYSGQGNSNSESSNKQASPLRTSGYSGPGNSNANLGTLDSSELANYSAVYGLGTIGRSGLGNLNANPSYRPAYGLGSVGTSGLGSFNSNSSFTPAYGLGTLGSRPNVGSASYSVHISSAFGYCQCDMCKTSFRQ